MKDQFSGLSDSSFIPYPSSFFNEVETL